MVDALLLETLDQLTSGEQKAMLAVADFLKNQRGSGADAEVLAESLLAELPSGGPNFSVPDEGLSPARIAARQFMRENPLLMHLLAQ